MSVRVYYWDDQRLGNNQIKVGKKRDVEWFKQYIIFMLEPLDRNIRCSTKEPDRRYYVEDIHIDCMLKDPRINLKKGYVWKENT